jgi:UDP-glucuronate decarboxylase
MSKLDNLIFEDVRELAHSSLLSPLDGKTITITGACGLLGIYLTAALKERSRFTGIPIMMHTVSLNQPPTFLSELFSGADMVHHACDLSDFRQCELLPAADYIIHAAGYGQPGKFLTSPSTTILLNTVATKILLEKLSSDGTFLFLSSSEVYSGSPRTPHQEGDIGTTDPSHVRACYIEGKRCGESLCHAYASYGLKTRIARVALAYGPGARLDDKRVLNSLIQSGLREKKIHLMDRGDAVRTYCYVSDAAEMLFSILLHAKQHTVYNVGGCSRVSIRELAQTIGRLLMAPVTVPDADERTMAGAPSEVVVSRGRYSCEFDKQKFVSLSDGLSRTIAWYQELSHH